MSRYAEAVARPSGRFGFHSATSRHATMHESLGETLSTADVIIRAIEQAYLKSKEDRTMSVPTEKKLLQRIKAGKEDGGILPVPPDESIGAGDILIFREATFSLHQIPTLVPNGDSVSMRITKAEDTGEKYGGSRLYAFRWQGMKIEAPTPRPSP